MKTYFLVSIDTEEDWEIPGLAGDTTLANIYQLASVQNEVFDRFNVTPLYLPTYPVANDRSSVSLINSFFRAGACEIGAHLHNWNSPPFTREDVLEKSYHFRLPYETEKKKILELTELIEGNFGTRPCAFRAGRWGADGETAKILAEVGYKVDLSVSPFTDHTPDGGPDFYGAPAEPYFPSFEDIKKPARESENDRLLEIPVTCGFSRPDFEAAGRLYSRLRKGIWPRLRAIGALARLGILRKIKLSPETATFGEMRSLVDSCLARGHRVLHLTFHSSMCSPGHSPYSKNELSAAIKMERLRDILGYVIKRKGIKCSRAGDIYEYWRKK